MAYHIQMQCLDVILPGKSYDIPYQFTADAASAAVIVNRKCMYYPHRSIIDFPRNLLVFFIGIRITYRACPDYTIILQYIQITTLNILSYHVIGRIHALLPARKRLFILTLINQIPIKLLNLFKILFICFGKKHHVTCLYLFYFAGIAPVFLVKLSQFLFSVNVRFIK